MQVKLQPQITDNEKKLIKKTDLLELHGSYVIIKTDILAAATTSTLTRP